MKMNRFATTAIALSLIFLVSCMVGALKQAEIDPWLATISGGESPEINIAGKWRDAKGNSWLGWGEGYLRQDQGKINGAIGNYNIKGVVAGKYAYLVFLYGGDVYYTLRLEMIEDGLLVGNYFEANDKTQKNGYPTSFERMEITSSKTL
ncbi:hypothetical protein [uncultured Desulfosarcina sp.]|uniref:hypothetical protein n=1 Tax=uncultured Desulfosarcina sp. TaxID=218289 RepID=UPI0029C8D7E9|nr:hypothetical protein [uncultured Desulfosarcina sp.]